jgi:hypothetical protein
VHSASAKVKHSRGPKTEENKMYGYGENPQFAINRIRADRIELPTVFKYASPESYVLQSIRNGELYFNHVDDFNDPIETPRNMRDDGIKASNTPRGCAAFQNLMTAF